jgi:NAD(P)-dependent dehydrogenase (short-subunit alcohol dehydrogenase family)
MARIFITGSAGGLSRAAAQPCSAAGTRSSSTPAPPSDWPPFNDLIDRGGSAVVGDLSDLNQTRAVADQVNQLGRVDAVIHNAGISSGPQILPVNVVAPYLLTALIHRPQRLVYLSSGMHHGGRADLAGVDWSGQSRIGSYSDSKLFVTTLAAAVARIWPDVYSNAVDPGWVPTRMGGPGAPDDLRLGHLTQEWLATSDEPEARSSGGYWFHQRLRTPHPAVHNSLFQDSLLAALARFTAAPLN